MNLPLPTRFRFPLLLVPLLAIWSGCATNNATRSVQVDRAPLSYAIVLFLGEGTDLTKEDRTFALSFARDTLLASGLVSPYDRLIDDPERAELLFRARMDEGQLVEIAGVPSVTNQTTVVLSGMRRTHDRIWWDTSYPYGPPTYYPGIHSGFPIPGPGWGHPRRPRENHPDRDRGDRDGRGNGAVTPPSSPPPPAPQLRPRPPERQRPTYTPPPPEPGNHPRSVPRPGRGKIDRTPVRSRPMN